ncbi:MAG: rod shape-determining protein MreC [Rubrobacter sp.]|nr:rod shape-determining protein MreC [Rubrobacter sp.]
MRRSNTTATPSLRPDVLGRRKSSAAGSLVVLAVLCVASLALFTIYVREGDSGPLHTVQLGAAEVLRPVRGLLDLAASPLVTASERVGRAVSGDDQEQFDEKALEYEEGAAETARLRQENERLRKLLSGEQTSFKYSPLGQVVSPVGGQLTKRVVINIGTKDGVAPEQPVVVGNNTLIGRTTSRVTPNTAEVLLVDDQTFAAGVQILPGDGSTTDSHGEGLLRTSWEGYLGVDYVDLNAKAEQGDFVVTSGRAGERELLFPPGLLVGTVESVSSRDIDQYKKIIVTPAAKADDLQEVRVIVGW